jgi:2,4-dienoyl-CoA reductase-like NADH-dependent reductase (Old Yellow Enzyme family)
MSSGAPDRDNRFRYRDAESLRTVAGDLDLELPWSDDVSNLLEPVRIGSHLLPNRLVVHPMEACDATADGGPSEPTQRRYSRYAVGGAGLIWFEATAVVPEARANPRQLLLNEGNAAGFTKVVERTRKAAHDQFGTGHNPVLVLQLTHSGRWSRPSGTPSPTIAHHNPDLDAMVGIGAEHPVIADDDLESLQDSFVAAAQLAVSSGFDGVDIKSCHGYLGSELLASHTRDGRYGGELANRSRFLYDGLPYPYGFGVHRDDATRPDLTEPLELLRKLHAAGCPLANISIGIPYWRPHLGRPFDRAVPGSPASPEHPLVGVVRLLQLAGELQAALPELPLVGTGYSWLRHHFPNVGAGAVSAGKTTLVGVGRMAFAYPDFARDLIEHGKLEFLKSCCACSGCTQLMRSGDEAGCVVRDREAYRLPRKRRKGNSP